MKSFDYPKFPSNIPHFMERVNTYCARVLPLVFDNSLSYYEFLGHMQHKLNEVIKALNSQNLVFVEFTHMIELEMQHFESYIEKRQQNFEESMQQEWDAFKTEIQGEWAAFKTEMQQAWADEQALNAQFRTDMQQAFTNFQNTITAQQTAFETAIRNQQNQFQTDMTSRQNTFEDTMEDNFEQWKVDTLAALHAGIQQFEQDTLTAIENRIQELMAENGGAMITAAEHAVEGEQINVAGYAVSKYNGSTFVSTDVFSNLTAETISPDTCYVFTSSAAWDLINHIMLAKTAPDYPALDWTAHIGVYSSDSNSLNDFDFSEIVETNSAAMQRGTMDLFGGYGGRSTKKYHWFCIWFTYATPSTTPTFTCDLTDKIFCYGAGSADITIQDRSTGAGIKYLIPKQRAMDSAPTSGHTNNVVSSDGIYNALNAAAYTTPTITDTTRVRLMAGGYIKIGNLVTVCMQLDVSQNLSPDFIIASGFPIPLLIAQVPVSNDSGKALYIDDHGNLKVGRSSVPADVLHVAVTYPADI